MDANDLGAIWLTLKLASIVTALLLLIGTPIAWWLARTRSRLKGVIGAVVALPLLLPPTVLGFYLLLAKWSGRATDRITWFRHAAIHLSRLGHCLRFLLVSLHGSASTKRI